MESRNDIATQLCVACLGAGVITTMAVAQGQSPLTALGITLFSGIAAVRGLCPWATAMVVITPAPRQATQS